MNDTIVAIATPQGEGAIGMVRLSGPKARAAARAFVRLPLNLAPKRATLAQAWDGERLLDRVVLTWHPDSESPTGEEVVELAAHGSPYILRRLLELAVQAGARPAEPGEFTQRSFLNGKLDLTQAEAVCDLIRSRTNLAHRAAIEQMEGGLSQSIQGLRQGIVDLLAEFEVALDHSEEDQSLLTSPAARAELAPLLERASRVLRSCRSGRLASEGLKVAILGAPNVGKSSLLNALLGRQRAIVLDRPGTTRDTLEEAADLGGLLCVLVDTAGLRSGCLDPAEALGIERARRAAERADILLPVLDSSRPLEDADREVLSLCSARSAVLVLNKSDLPRRLCLDGLETGAERVGVSALLGTGLETLSAALRRAAGLGREGEPEGILAATVRQISALENAAQALRKADAILLEGREDFAETGAHHLRRALDSLDALLGRDAGADVLRSIFSRFCVGK